MWGGISTTILSLWMWKEGEAREAESLGHHQRAVKLMSEETRAYPVGLPGTQGFDFGTGALGVLRETVNHPKVMQAL